MEDDLFLKSINEDLKYNGFKKWLLYLRFFVKYKNELDEEELEDIREKIVYNFNKENNINNYEQS